MAFTTGYGGFSTLVGTPPNVIVSEALRQAGYRPFGFFEFAWVGIPLALAGMLYLATVGKRLLPDRNAAPADPGHPGPDIPGAPEFAPGAKAVLGQRDRARMFLSGFILVAVVVAGLLALFLENYDPVVRSPTELASLRLIYLGSVPGKSRAGN